MMIQKFVFDELRYYKTDIVFAVKPEIKLKDMVRGLVRTYGSCKYPYDLARRANYIEKWTKKLYKEAKQLILKKV